MPSGLAPGAVVGVAGCGVMGRGIAQVVLQAGERIA